MYDENTQVLIVSNNPENIKSAVAALKHLKFKDIAILDNGLEALQGMTSKSWGLVICDCSMNQIDGWTFVKELKLSDKVPNLPVILMGRNDPPDEESKLKDYGVVKYAKLPVAPSQLDFLIHSTLTLFHSSGTIENKFSKAKDSLIKQNNEEAIELFSELKSLTKNSLRSNVGLAQAFLQNDQSDEAEPIIQEIADSSEVSPQKLIMKARLAFKKNQEDVATESIAQLLDTSPTEFYYVRSVKLCLDNSKPVLGKPFAEQAIEQTFRQMEFYNCLARCAVQDQDYEKALEYLKSSEEIGGQTPELFNMRGVCLRKMGSFSEAVFCYEEALRLDPTDAKIYFNLAICTIDMKDFDLALQYLNSCLEISPTFSRAKEKISEIKGKLAS